jgi:hypothetical protein
MKKNWFAAFVVVASLGLLACEASEPEPAVPESAKVGGDGGGMSGGGLAAQGAGGDDVGVLCSPGEQVCDSICVDLQTSPTDCGSCGHDCGGGACFSGMCQPMAMADANDSLNAPAALAVNGSKILWAEATSVRSCPLPFGCLTTTPATVASGLQQLQAIAATNSKVYFSGCKPTTCDDWHELYECPVAGCPTPFSRITRSVFSYGRILIGQTRAYGAESGESLVGCSLASCAATPVRWQLPGFDEFFAVETDGATIYLHTGSDIRTCPDSSGCAVTTVLPGSSAVTTTFRAHNGKLYWYVPAFFGEIRSCDIANCSATDTLFTPEEGGQVELEVDAHNLYWMNSTIGTIQYCPLTGCPPSGPYTLYLDTLPMKELTLGSNALYWIEGNSIFKLAKP